MIDLSETIRLFSMEGATHLYSSLPSMLTPADLYHIKDNPVHKAALAGSNIYLIVSRHRIYLNPESLSRNGRIVLGEFLVLREHGVTVVPFTYEIRLPTTAGAADILGVAVAANGSSMVVMTSEGDQMIAVSVIVAAAESELTRPDTDMEVLYVGQSIGRTNTLTALNRLLSHTKFQQILAENSTHSPEREVLLLLYRFEHRRTIISNGGDFNVEAQATDAQDSAHFNRLRDVRLQRHEVVSLAEAALINYFKPRYNTLLKKTNFAASEKLRVLQQLMKKGVAGLVVELCSVNIRSRLGSANAIPIELVDLFSEEVLEGRNIQELEIKQQWQEELNVIAHSHWARFALTTTQERNTFLHGSKFMGQTEQPWAW